MVKLWGPGVVKEWGPGMVEESLPQSLPDCSCVPQGTRAEGSPVFCHSAQGGELAAFPQALRSLSAGPFPPDSIGSSVDSK